MPELLSRHEQPDDDAATGREHARPPAGDQPTYPPTADRDAISQTSPGPDLEASAAFEGDPTGPRGDALPPDGTVGQDVSGQQEAATPEADSVLAAAEPLATLPLRLLAFAVDLGWVTLALLVPVLIGTLVVDSLWVLAVVLPVGLITYHTVWVWLSGQTPGKAMYDLSVRHGPSAPRPDLAGAAVVPRAALCRLPDR